jgi:hypothetical protein
MYNTGLQRKLLQPSEDNVKTNNTYKMSKYLRTQLALCKFKTPEQKTAFKKSMKAAEAIFNSSSYAVVGGKSE